MSRWNALLFLASIALTAVPARAQVPSRNMQLLAHMDDYHVAANGLPYAYSACWSYVHGDGREYAVIGASGGTAIYNVTNPASTYRVGFIPGPPSIWREMKQYRSWIYVVTEGHDVGEGLQIIRMTDPEHPVLAATYTSATFASAHTVTVDTARALLVTNGSKSDAGGGAYPFTGMHIFSLTSPEAPAELSVWPPGGPFDSGSYVHDAVIAGTRLYAASIYAGTERVIDLANPAAPSQIAGWTYPAAYYTHNSWPDSTGRYLYVTDEHNGQTLRVFDIANLAAPVLVNGISANPVAIVHNAFVKGHELYLSNYTEGLRALDLTDPVHPAEFGWADTYPGPSGGYGGAWGACPYFPSGTVIASDMETGLYVFRPVRNYGLLRVRVVDGDGQALANARVRLTTQGDSLVTPSDGVVMFAPSPGSHTVAADRFGHARASAPVSVASGDRDTVTVTLPVLATTSFAGALRDRSTHAALGGGEVDLSYTPLQALTDSTGGYRLDAVPEDDYAVQVHRPGYVPLSFTRHIGLSASGEDFNLIRAATWDSLESGAGWTIGATGDNATSGTWVDAAPVGTGTSTAPPTVIASAASPARLGQPSSDTLVPIGFGLPGLASDCGNPQRAAIGTACPTRSTMAGATPAGEEPPGHCGCGATCTCGVSPAAATSGQIKPWSDRTPGAGTRCFITGQAPSHVVDPDQYDLDGRTTLTSPAFDMRGMSDPVIGWWRWWYSVDPGTGQPDPADFLAVLVSGDNGATWVAADTIRGMHNAWEEQAIHVARFVAPGAQVRVRFIASDTGNNSTDEAGIDDVTSYDGALAVVDTPAAAMPPLAFGATSPNPFVDQVGLTLTLVRGGTVTVDVLDVAGRHVRTLRRGAAAAGTLRLSWDGRNDRGGVVPPGVYMAEARLEGARARVRLIRIP